jgi:serine/threonine protein kinase
MENKNHNLEALYPSKIGPYLLKNVIGRGKTCTVVLATDMKGKKEFACKIISKQHFKSNSNVQRFMAELKIIQTVRHPNIVEFYEYFEDSINFYLIEEFCKNGDLGVAVINSKSFTEPRASTIMYQILRALDYLHSRNIAHRDIKPENVLLDDKYNVKLADFGFAVNSDGSCLCRTLCGTLQYIAPEVLSGNPYDPMKADVWSCGVLLFAIVTGTFPWKKKNFSALKNEIINNNISVPHNLSVECRDIILKLCEKNVDNRISIHDAFMHPFVQSAANFVQDVKVKEEEQIKSKRTFSTPLPRLRQYQGSSTNADDIDEILSLCKRKRPRSRFVRPSLIANSTVSSQLSTRKLSKMRYMRCSTCY